VAVPPVIPNDMRAWGMRILHHFLVPMLDVLATLAATLSSVFKTRTGLQLENLALRHQLGVLRRSAKRLS
jgi:hypothetical protein